MNNTNNTDYKHVLEHMRAAPEDRNAEAIVKMLMPSIEKIISAKIYKNSDLDPANIASAIQNKVYQIVKTNVLPEYVKTENDLRKYFSGSFAKTIVDVRRSKYGKKGNKPHTVSIDSPEISHHIDSLIAPNSDPMEMLMSQEPVMNKAVRAELKKAPLSKSERNVLHAELKRGEDISRSGYARTLGITPSNYATTLYYAQEKLKKTGAGERIAEILGVESPDGKYR